MDFLFEFIFTFLLEGIFGLTVKNPKVKNWVKTTVFLVFSEAFVAFIFWMGCQSAGDTRLFVQILAIALGIFFFVMAIKSHKLEWKQEYSL